MSSKLHLVIFSYSLLSFHNVSLSTVMMSLTSWGSSHEKFCYLKVSNLENVNEADSLQLLNGYKHRNIRFSIK